MTEHQKRCSCVEDIDFHARINHPIKHKRFYHLKYHTPLGEFVWLITKQIPKSIYFFFDWAWFRPYGYCKASFIRPWSGVKLAWDIAYICNEVW